jgi:hypothetical protein
LLIIVTFYSELFMQGIQMIPANTKYLDMFVYIVLLIILNYVLLS